VDCDKVDRFLILRRKADEFCHNAPRLITDMALIRESWHNRTGPRSATHEPANPEMWPNIVELWNRYTERSARETGV